MAWNGRLDIIKEKLVILKARQQPKVKHKEELECAKIQRESRVCGSTQLVRNKDNFQQPSSQKQHKMEDFGEEYKKKRGKCKYERMISCLYVYVSCFKIFGQYRIYTNKTSLQKSSMMKQILPQSCKMK